MYLGNYNRRLFCYKKGLDSGASGWDNGREGRAPIIGSPTRAWDGVDLERGSAPRPADRGRQARRQDRFLGTSVGIVCACNKRISVEPNGKAVVTLTCICGMQYQISQPEPPPVEGYGRVGKQLNKPV